MIVLFLCYFNYINVIYAVDILKVLFVVTVVKIQNESACLNLMYWHFFNYFTVKLHLFATYYIVTLTKNIK